MDLTWVTIPRSEKAPRLMNWPLPSKPSQWSLIQHLNCLQPERWNRLQSCSLRLRSASSGASGSVGHGHRRQNSSFSDLPHIFSFSSLLSSTFLFFSLFPLFPYSFIFLFFLIFLYLCSGIVIRHQCYSGPKNVLLFCWNKSTLSPWVPEDSDCPCSRS